MKTLRSVLLIAAMCVLIFSCKKDEDKDNPADYSFSKEGVDADKSKVEDAGQQLVAEMKAMENLETTNVLEAFVDCNESDDPFGTTVTKSAPVFRTINAASSVTSGENPISYLSQMMKADVTEEPNSFQEVYDEYKGIYTWSVTNKVWTKTTSAEFKFIFPSKKGGTTNDASLVITYTGKTGLQPLENYEGDLPAAFNATIKVKDAKVFEVDFAASYNSDGLPTSVKYFVALYPFKYEISWTYSASSLSLRYHLTNNSKTIIDCYGNVGGNFSKSNLVNEDTELDDVFTNGNAYFQVFNVKLAGDVDFKSLYNAHQKIYTGIIGFKTDSAFAQEINKYLNLDLVLADSKQKIASTEAYPNRYTRNVYDWNLGKYVTKEYSEISMKFIFANGSKDDWDAYFSKGFEDLVNDMNSFIVELNNNYGLGLDEMDYGN